MILFPEIVKGKFAYCEFMSPFKIHYSKHLCESSNVQNIYS